MSDFNETLILSILFFDKYSNIKFYENTSSASTINIKHLFDTNNEIHKYKTRNNNNLHRPVAKLSKFNKGAYISGINVFNHLPQYIKALTNDQKYFKSTLKRFLYHHSFYSMNMNIRKTEEYKP